MGVFTVAMEIGDPEGQRFEAVEALVDTGASYSALPASLLKRLGVTADESRPFMLADGRQVDREIGQTWVRIDGRLKMTVVVFADEGTRPLLGAVTLEEFGLGIDAMAKRLIEVPGYLMRAEDAQSLIDSDFAHQLHPQYHVRDHADPVIYVRGEGALIWDIHGNEYIDGLAALWNVAVGHGRAELADAASEQMRTLAFSNSYAGYANVPSIKLAEKLMTLAYPNMQAVLFSNSGSEAVEAAFKIARFFWHLQGKPDKVKIVSRKDAYHGGTLGATAAAGLPGFHTGFGPIPGGFVRAETCYPYRCPFCQGDGDDCGRHCAGAIERVIIDEGPETVAAVIAEPVHGAGGVIVPADGYWQRLREICDRHDVLLIADEVITGFGRTGKWFALEHWDVQPDIMSVAKAITSAYVPLAGTIVSARIHEAMQSTRPEAKFWHGYTNAGHPAACAVALRNIQIIEDEDLVQRADAMGRRLIDGLASIEHPNVGEVRGLGLIAAIELVADRSTRERFDASQGVGARVVAEMRRRGVITRARGESILLAPPLVITEAQVDRIIETVEGSIQAVVGV